MTSDKLEWWDVPNDRRQQLILKKWKTNEGLTEAETLEYILLQKLADMVIDYGTDLLILKVQSSDSTKKL